ncbi:MAG: nucleotidyltransferase family protein [Anaerolineaceae bacterium]|nr:nucleotidyltransferase family protein [Anaerolineaceae bacterium]
MKSNLIIDAPAALLRPEAALLLSCARRPTAEVSSTPVMALLQTDLDWDYLLQLAARHGLIPLLYTHLSQLGAGRVPKPVLAKLWAGYELNARHSQFLAEELAELLHLLESSGIRALPYKGPVLARLLYGHVALRHAGDLDILVSRADALRARELITGRGYRSTRSLTPGQATAYLHGQRYYHFELVHPTHELLVELHWRIGHDLFSVATDRLFEGTELAASGLDQSAPRLLSPEVLLLVLAIHGSRHHWQRLIWLVDLAELIRGNPGLDWPRALNLARSFKCERMLFFGLSLARTLLDLRLPASVAAAIEREPIITTLAAAARRPLFTEVEQPLTNDEELYFEFNLLTHWTQRLRYSFDLFMGPTFEDWTRWSLPASLSFLYYPLRLVRLASKHTLKRFSKHLYQA